MSKRSLAKSHDEFLQDCMDAYRREHEGAFRMEDMAQWILDNGLLPAPRIDPVRLLTRTLKQAARRMRFRDKQGRRVRKMLAAKIDRIDANGNRIIDVVWDYLHEMSLDHALIAFTQRDEIIEKQKLAATRDVHSVLDNNPNIAGHETQFTFSFMVEEPIEIIEEKIGETSGGVVSPDGQAEPHHASRTSRPKPR